ncbi:MAG: FecR domain-containing protein [Verrucomicrobiota bacterium]|nr:FecR domain-containing protein [Verrucomicrobiota bacterium]
MKESSSFPCALRAIALVSALSVIGSFAHATELKEARVTQIVKDVKLLPGQAAPRPASVNDTVHDNTAVRTGAASRTELTFTDKTISRLGANTIFSFAEGTRNMDLKDGAMLLRVPKNAGGAKITSAAVTAAITGTTVMFEAHPATTGSGGNKKTGYYKFICLEGTARLYDPKRLGESVLVKAGQMVIGKPGQPLSDPVDVDIKKILETSLLITGFGPLGSENLMAQEVAQQQNEKNNGQLYDTNLAIFGGGTAVALGSDATDQARAAMPPSPSNPPPPPPSGSKYGPPATIAGNYQINSTTQINTDPTITTNGVTNNGTIYRNFAQDGLRSLFFFGGSRAFDSQSGFDLQNQPSFNLDNIAVFKFDSLQLVGNPTVTTPGGAPTKLALVGVNGITTGAPGGSLTFSGLDTLLLATQSGNIVLGSEVSFQNIQNLVFYARGTNASLQIGSAINGTNLLLNSEGTTQVNGNVNVADYTAFSGGDYQTGTGLVMANNVAITSLTGNVNIDTSLLKNNGTGGSVVLNATNTLNIAANGGGGGTGFAWDTLNATGNTINITTNSPPNTFDYSNSSSVTFTAGTGGINASTTDFVGPNLTMDSQGAITVSSVTLPYAGNSPDLSGSLLSQSTITSTNGDLQSLSISASGTITSAGAIYAGDIYSSTDITAASDITAVGGDIHALGNITSTNGSLYTAGGGLGFSNIIAGGNISAGGIFTPDSSYVSAGGSISAPGIIAGALTAGTDITIDNTAGVFSFGIIADTIMIGGTLYMINSPTIQPDGASYSNNDGSTPYDFSLTAGSIVSTGPTYPILFSDGGDANPNFADSNPGNGGKITLNITNGNLTVGPGGDLHYIASNGGMYNPGGPFGGGNAGLIDITVSGNVTITGTDNLDPAINTLTGTVSDVTSQYLGAGGTVNVTSGGLIDVSGEIKVSEEDAGEFGSTGAGRESASGGTILLQSNLSSGAGITIDSTGTLFSRLSGNAPGPAGSITLSTMGADITVNGTVRADFGTITIDQNDPAGMTPTITLDGSTLQGATFDINGSGNLDIGATSNTAINIFGGTWNVPGDITLNAANTSFAYAFALNATAGGAINFTGGSPGAPATLTLPLSGDSTFAAPNGSINAQYVDILYSGAGLNLIAGSDITANSIAYTDYYTRGSVNAGGSITTTNDLYTADATSGSSIDVGGNAQGSTINAGTTLTVGGFMQVDRVTAGGDITAGTTYVQTIDAPTGVLNVANGINPYVFSTDPSFVEQGAMAPHVYTVDSVISPNGIDFSGNQFGGINGYTSGGILTINANSFDGSQIGPINFDGADAGATDFNGMPFTNVGGDGGIFIVNAQNDLTINRDISATTGNNLSDPNNPTAAEYHGAGGSVTLSSANGTVNVNGTVQVSSNEAVPYSTVAPQPYRKSASGGSITLKSTKKTGVAINVANTAQLLALLDAAAPGPGGKVTITAGNPGGDNSNDNSSINIEGTVIADRGTIDIGHYGDSGVINISGAGSTTTQLSADIVKAQVYGANGTLNIGNTQINADSILKLYASGANGTVNFVGDVTLSGQSVKTIYGDTVNVYNGVSVNVQGPAPADVYTNHANYSATNGGNGQMSGQFTGQGANTHLGQAPPGGSAAKPPGG